MSVVSADLLQLSIVEEATPGVTPATPSWLVVPVTASNLTVEASTQVSNLLNPRRSVADSFLTNLQSTGDLPIELGHTPSVKLLMESAFASVFADPAAGPPTPPSGAPGVADEFMDVGITKKTFTVEARYPDPNLPAGNYLYTRFAGSSVNTWTVEADPDNVVTSSFNLLGAEATTDTAEIVGSTYDNLSGYEVYRGPDFVTLQFGSLTGQLPCLSALTLSHDNQLRPQRCLGSLYNKDIILGQFSPSGSGSHYYQDNDLLDALIAQTPFVLTVELKTANDQYLAFEYFNTKLTANVVSNTGTNSDVMDELTWQSSDDATELTPVRLWLED